MPYPIIIRMLAGSKAGEQLLKIGSNQLKKYMARGATPIKNPTSTQIKKAKIPNKEQKERVRKRSDKHIKRVQKKAQTETYNPQHNQPEGYSDLFEGDEKGVNRFKELEDMRGMDDPMNQYDVTIKKKKGGSVKGRQRGMGVALRGGGRVTRS